MANKSYFLILIILVVVLYDFFTRVWSPVSYESNASDVMAEIPKIKAGEPPKLPTKLMLWFDQAVKEEDSARANPKGPTAEEIEARKKAEQRERMKNFGVSFGDFVFVLRGVSIGSIKIAIFEILEPSTEQIITQKIVLNKSYNGFRLEAVEPLSVTLSNDSGQVKIPLFKSSNTN